MRVAVKQAQALRQLAQHLAGDLTRLRLFGYRLDGSARGGDVDLLLELPDPAAQPAPQAVRFSAQATHLLDGRKVDALPAAPNLAHLPIHDISLKEGQLS